MYLLNAGRLAKELVTMSTKNKPLFLTIVFSFFALGVYGQDQQSEGAGAVLSVNDLAAKATQHLGDVRLVGVVAAVSQTVRVDGTLQQTDKGLSLVAKDFHVL